MANDLKARLTAMMKSWPVPIEPGCEYHLSQLIDQAAQNFQAGGFTSDPKKFAEAENNFQKLLAQMTLEAGKLGYNELHEPTFFKVMSRICPLFPFC